MEKLNFYYVDKKYVQYLKDTETQKRGLAEFQIWNTTIQENQNSFAELYFQ